VGVSYQSKEIIMEHEFKTIKLGNWEVMLHINYQDVQGRTLWRLYGPQNREECADTGVDGSQVTALVAIRDSISKLLDAINDIQPKGIQAVYESHPAKYGS
jgi:hypothetical protein